MVKSLWRTACRANPRLWGETDLFLVYLRAYFYNDPVLAEAILRFERDADGTIRLDVRSRVGRSAPTPAVRLVKPGDA